MTQEEFRLACLGLAALAFGSIVGIYWVSQRRSAKKWDQSREKLTEAFTPPKPDDFREVNG